MEEFINKNIIIYTRDIPSSKQAYKTFGGNGKTFLIQVNK